MTDELRAAIIEWHDAQKQWTTLGETRLDIVASSHRLSEATLRLYCLAAIVRAHTLDN